MTHSTEEARLITQTIFKTPENDALGIYGNCIQAAVAMLVDKPLDYVPHFGAFATWQHALRLWLRGEQMDYTAIRRDALSEGVPMGRALLFGDTDRGTRHAVASIDGVIYDPHPSRAGLTHISGCFVFHEWTEFDGICFVCKRGPESTIRAAAGDDTEADR